MKYFNDLFSQIISEQGYINEGQSDICSSLSINQTKLVVTPQLKPVRNNPQLYT